MGVSGGDGAHDEGDDRTLDRAEEGGGGGRELELLSKSISSSMSSGSKEVEYGW